MEFVKMPNLPQAAVKLAVVDGRIEKDLEAGFEGLGVTIARTLPHAGVYAAIAGHPDIMLHHLGDEYIVYAPGTDKTLLKLLSEYGFTLVKGSVQLAPQYPRDIAYNVARVGNKAFCNTKYTDPVLKGELMERGVQLVHVNQGYAKCSVAIVNDSAIMTSDPGIAKTAQAHGLDVLQIKTGPDIRLPGLGCGFIGGSSGLLGRNLWAVTGDIFTLEDARSIVDFLEIRGIRLISLKQGAMIDIGSVLPLRCE